MLKYSFYSSLILIILSLSLISAQFGSVSRRRNRGRNAGGTRGRITSGFRGLSGRTRRTTNPPPTTPRFTPKTLEEVAENSRIRNESDAMFHLVQFGYLPYTILTNGLSAVNTQELRDKTKAYQQIARIPESGILDPLTIQSMNRPRCGNSDSLIIQQLGSGRVTRSGYKWHRNDLKYAITSYTSDLQQQRIDNVLADAFKVWSETISLKFTKVNPTEPADIKIKFSEGDHGDSLPFDGVSKVYLHAFPPEDSRIHLDDAETWVINRTAGADLIHSVIHAIGHTLGLEHSENELSVMYPYFGTNHQAHLHVDDHAALWDIYGYVPTTTTTTTTATTTTNNNFLTRPAASTMPPLQPGAAVTPPIIPEGVPTPGPDPCRVARWDALTTTSDGNTYLFVDKFYFHISNDVRQTKIPRNTSTDWPQLPEFIESALTLPSGFTVFFSNYWFDSFANGQQRVDDEINYIQHYFPDLPFWKIDAAWTLNGSVYASSEGQYWMLGGGCQPKTIRDGWRAPPSLTKAHAAGRIHGKLYLIQYNMVYLINELLMVTEYKGSIGEMFFGCKAEEVNPPAVVVDENGKTTVSESFKLQQLANNEIASGASRPIRDPNSPSEFNTKRNGPFNLEQSSVLNKERFLQSLRDRSKPKQDSGYRATRGSISN